MPKSKYAPALFEVIHRKPEEKRPGRFQLPKWWRSNQLATSSPSTVPETQVEPAEAASSEVSVEAPVAEVAERIPEPVSEPFWAIPADTVAREPAEHLVRLSIGDKTYAMSTVGATVVLGVFLVALFASFELGNFWGSSGSGKQVASLAGGLDEVEQAVSQPPKPEVLKITPPAVATAKPKSAESAKVASPKPVTAPPAAKSPPPVAAEPAKKTEGSTYVVLETFSGDHKSSADFAQKWLQNKNIKTTLEKKGNRWRLISAEGFDFGRAEENQRAQQYIDNVKSLGKTMGGDMARAGLPNYLVTEPLLERIDR